MSLPCFLTLPFSLFFFYALPSFSHSVVPPSQTFNHVNEGEFGPYITEYDASYRILPIAASPFQMAFYNTTPGEYTLAVRLGYQRSEPIYRWVWEANRYNPVGENATFSLGADGNLVLAEADGKVVWQSNTANKGVVSFDMLPNGNLVLQDSRGNFVWQSFDTATNTILVGQSLRLNGTNKLVSRLSQAENKNGPYSFVLEPRRLVMYYASKNSPKPVLYFDSTNYIWLGRKTVDFLKFDSLPLTNGNETYAYELVFETPDATSRIARPKYNTTFTYLRLGIDGSLTALTYNNRVDYSPWDLSYTIFPRENGRECHLPERCGQFGLCEDSQCVACPSPNGLLGWSKNCAPPKITSCKASDITYYKLEGVDHFTSEFNKGIGPMKENDCKRRCTSDCKCAGFFFKQAESRCWIAYDLLTLIKVDNSTHVGYIKTPIR